MTAGVLVVDKPRGVTSHDVVAAARRALGERRIGHCGTLDPMATGVLVLAIGAATRLAQFLASATKHYDATIQFGVESSTGDATGDIVSESPARPTRVELESALARFRGRILQVPPAYSAKKVGGVRAYAVARRGGTAPALAPVPVTVHELALTAFDGERASLAMAVSAGFYVRSLAHDLGRALGTGALLEALRRTRAGSFGLEDAVTLDRLAANPGETAGRVVPLERLLPEVPGIHLTPAEVRRAAHGMDVRARPDTPVQALVRLLDDTGRLVALAVPADRPGFLHPSVVFGYH